LTRSSQVKRYFREPKPRGKYILRYNDTVFRTPENQLERIKTITVQDHDRLLQAAELLRCPAPPQTTEGYVRKPQVLLLGTLIRPKQPLQFADLIHWLSVGVQALRLELAKPERQLEESDKLLKLKDRDLFGLTRVVRRQLRLDRALFDKCHQKNRHLN
jgi:hypothetical protein